MIPNCSTRQFDAVTHDVVLKGLDRQRILRLEGHELTLRHRERIVAEDDLLRVLVPLVHGEVRDPAKTKGALLDEVELFAELGSEFSRQWIGNLAPIAHEKDGVTGLGAARVRETTKAVEIEEFRDGPPRDALAQRDPPKPWRSLFLGPCLQPIEEAPGSRRGPRAGYRTDHRASRGGIRKQ